MAFLALLFAAGGLGPEETDAVVDSCFGGLTLLSEGRKIDRTDLGSGIVMADVVAGDCWAASVQNGAGSEPTKVYCFGWCCLRDGNDGNFNEQAARRVVEEVRRDPGGLDKVTKLLTGNYTLLVVDAAARRLAVLTDAFATRGFYYCSDGRQVAIGSRAALVANAIGTKLNGMAWVANLRGTLPPPSETLFAGVKRSTAGQSFVASWNPVDARIQSRPTAPFHAEAWKRTESVGRLTAAITSAVQRCARNLPLCVDLTGGNDSRLTAAVLSRETLGAETYFKVIGNPNSGDVRVATEIAERFGWRLLHREKETLDCGTDDQWRRAALLLDGIPVDSGSVAGMLRDQEIHLPHSFHLGSLGGELGRDYFWEHEYFRPWRHAEPDLSLLVKRRLYADGVLPNWSNGFQPPNRRDHDAYLVSEFEKRPPTSGSSCKYYVLDFIYAARLARKMASLWMHAPARTVMLPFLSSEFLDVALRIPWWQRALRGVTLEAIARLSPELSGIPHNTGLTMTPLRIGNLPEHFKGYSRRFLERVVRYRGERIEVKSSRRDRDSVHWFAAEETLPEEAGSSLKNIRSKLQSGAEIVEWEERLLNGVESLHYLLGGYSRIQRVFDFSWQSVGPFEGRVLLSNAWPAGLPANS